MPFQKTPHSATPPTQTHNYKPDKVEHRAIKIHEEVLHVHRGVKVLFERKLVIHGGGARNGDRGEGVDPRDPRHGGGGVRGWWHVDERRRPCRGCCARRARELVHRDAQDEQHERLPLCHGEDSLHDNLEQHCDGENLEVAQHFHRRWLEVELHHKLQVVVDGVERRGHRQQPVRPGCLPEPREGCEGVRLPLLDQQQDGERALRNLRRKVDAHRAVCKLAIGRLAQMHQDRLQTNQYAVTAH
mmetsp:Transcript_404/g.1359  ORF Transcript_404/g.1359 Transcript_404/m.1359 type:complete len:243 (-) Transcript_404:145-873(-)